jgi:CPA1 family monovalent cation:H+ antiporter
VAEGRERSATVERIAEARRSMLTAERGAIEHMRDSREINDEVYRRVLHELDLEEATIGVRG